MADKFNFKFRRKDVSKGCKNQWPELIGKVKCDEDDNFLVLNIFCY